MRLIDADKVVEQLQEMKERRCIHALPRAGGV